MRFTTLLATALLAAVVAPATARAAMCIDLSAAPTSPVAGRPATIAFDTYATYADGLLEPWRVPTYPFRVEAVSPTGRVYRVRVRPEEGNRWAGAFRFPRRGTWTVRVTNFAPLYERGCGEVLRLRVRARG